MRLLGGFGSIANLLPLVSREMREESRRALNYWLRVVAAASMVGVFIGFALSAQIESSRWGPSLFGVLSRGLILAIWIIVPAMTADCISREKREGTLGLLFLTPLTKLDVILGKAAANILRATTIVIAAVPLMTLPLVLGGVSWLQILAALTALATALLLGIAAGLFSSAKGGSTMQVIVWAELNAVGLFLAFKFFSSFAHAFTSPLGFRINAILYFVEEISVCAFLFVLAVAMTIKRLRETWDKDAAAPEQPKWVEAFSNSEFWQMIFRWERKRTRDRNPIAWLQEYSWTARLTKWGWCLGIVFSGPLILALFPGCQPQVILLFSLGVAFSAANSFRRERQSGLLEILLVTPISARKLAAGRLWGIFSHFFPALAILAVWWYADWVLNEKALNANRFVLVWPNPLAFITLMAFGLYLSLWRGNLMVIWLAAWIVAFFLPTFAAILLAEAGAMTPSTIISITSCFQLGLAFISWILLQRNLRERRFVVV